MREEFNTLLKASLKSEDTEEWIDIHFTRPVGLAIALACARLHIHPNAVTTVSIFLGMASGVMFYYRDLSHNIAGMALLMTANFLDSADGQLARLTNQKTIIGRMLDGLAGDIWFLFIYFAIVFRLWQQDIPFTHIHWGLWGFLLCSLAGFVCHSHQSSLADYYRQIHLFFLKGAQGSELGNSETARAKWKSFQGKGHFWDRQFWSNYTRYCHSQESRTPQFQRFIKALRLKYPNADDIPQQLRDDFRKGSLPLMKYTNMLTFNTRALLIYVCCIADVPFIYPIVEITIFKIVYMNMKRRHERLCATMYDKYCR